LRHKSNKSKSSKNRGGKNQRGRGDRRSRFSDKSEGDRGRSSFRRKAGPWGGDEGDNVGEQAEASLAAPAKHTKAAIKRWLTPPEQPPRPKDDNGELSLDPWQQEAFTHLLSGASVVVDAPTTAGKTRVVEAFFRARIHEPSFRACYTTPVKSLSNDKLLEFRQMFGPENVGISTGDIKENLHAPIVVATLESYRNSLLGTEPDLGRNLAVFDEYHFIQDASRGSAWEESIVLTPPECQLLLLSAGVSNSQEFASWLTEMRRRPCELVQATHRPVPLVNLVHCQSEWLLDKEIPPNFIRRLDPRRMRQSEPVEDMVKRILALEDLQLMPCIVYAGRRLTSETLARHLARNAKLLPEPERERIADAMSEVHEENQALRFIDPSLRNMIISYGISFHHSGMAAPSRVMVEHLLKNGLLRICVATMGLSIGINFSVRSALISDYTRPDESGLVEYAASEVLQMLGRAGRRGRDQVGFSLWPNAESFQKFGGAKRDRCNSSLKIDPTTLLGLLGRGQSLREIENFYGKSFRAYSEHRHDLFLIRPETVKKQLSAEKLPCSDPAVAYVQWETSEQTGPCADCPLRKNCHHLIRRSMGSDLAMLQMHLVNIGALQEGSKLSRFGSIARYIPQNGGLLVADMIAKGEINEENLMASCQLFAALSLATFKPVGSEDSYRFPWKEKELIAQLMDLYPEELFPNAYDRGGPKHLQEEDGPKWKEFNPAAGFVVKRWLQGCSWKELEQSCTNERFGNGDLMNLLFRTATYLQSLAGIPELSLGKVAKSLRGELLREPLSLSVFG